MRRLFIVLSVLALAPIAAAAFEDTPKKDGKKSESAKPKIAVFRLKVPCQRSTTRQSVFFQRLARCFAERPGV